MEKKITAIQVQKRNPDRLNIYLDGEFSFGVSRIVAAWLEIGQSLSDEKIEVLKSSDSDEVAYQKALRFIDYRDRTEKEVRQRLLKADYEPDQIENVITRLRNANLVQDEQFARYWVENRNENHPRSKRLIRYELRNKGIAESTIEDALGESFEESDLATRAAIQYVRKISDLDWLEFRKKLSAFLARRGFSYGTIAPVVQSEWNSLEKNQGSNWKNEEFENGK
jgi:regulatory protein